MLGFIDVSLPLIGFLALFQLIRQQGCEWRRAGVGAAVILGVFVTLMVEALSLPRALTRTGLTIGWLVFIIIAGVSLLKPPRVSGELTEVRKQTIRFQSLDGWSRALLYGAGLLASLVGITAVLSPPNTGDVLFYHMPRVVMWMSHRSVQFYPTLNYAQLIYGSWAEYAMLNLDLLFGGDRFVNLVQWLAYLGSAVAVSLIAQSLGARPAGQVLAAAVCGAIPVAVLEASGAKNNCVVAFWLATSVYFLLEFRRSPTWANTLGFGAAAALAIFTKGTSYLFLPAVVAAAWWIATPQAKRVLLYRLPVLGALLLIVNGPLYARNYRLTGSPTGVGFRDLDEELDFANQNHSIEGIAANVVRNVAIQLSFTDGLNAAIERWASGIIRLMGQSPNDPRAIKLSNVHRLLFRTNPASAREDMTGAPLHFFVIVLAILLAAAGWRRDPEAGWYALGLIVSFVVFSALLRWERWGVRYQIPLLVLDSALIGVVLDRDLPRVAPIVGIVLIVAALPLALRNELRPLLPVHLSPRSPIVRWSDNSILLRDRTDYYFADLVEDLRQSYISAAEAVRTNGCGRIALDLSFEDADYLFLAFLKTNENQPALSYRGVYNLTQSLADGGQPPPCTVVCFACSGVKRKWAEYRSVGGRASTFGDIAVFSAAGVLPNMERLPYADDQVQMGNIAGEMSRKFERINELNSWPEFAGVLADAEQLGRTHRNWAQEMRIRMESISRTAGDASLIMLHTSRLRTEASEGRQLDIDEREALLAADECLDWLAAEKVERLGELRNEERSIEGSVAASATEPRRAATSSSISR